MKRCLSLLLFIGVMLLFVGCHDNVKKYSDTYQMQFYLCNSQKVEQTEFAVGDTIYVYGRLTNPTEYPLKATDIISRGLSSRCYISKYTGEHSDAWYVSDMPPIQSFKERIIQPHETIEVFTIPFDKTVFTTPGDYAYAIGTFMNVEKATNELHDNTRGVVTIR